MIKALRHGINTNILWCTVLTSRHTHLDFGRFSQFFSLRQCSTKTPSQQQKYKNVDVLRGKDCGKRPPGLVPPDEGSNKTKWLLTLLAVGGLAGFLYYLTRKKDKGEKKPRILGKVPASSTDLPDYVPYLLVGGGTASFSAFRAIKSHDPKAKVLIISEELHKPYMRPPLSKELWYNAPKGKLPEDYKFQQWNGAERSLFYEPEEFYICPTKLMESRNGGVAVAHGYRVRRLDPCEQKAILADGKEIQYDKCLLATGCTPKSLEVFEAAPRTVKEKVTKFRTPFDYEELKHVSDTKKSIVVIGSGFLGSELSCALAKYGKERDLKVYQIFYENGNMAKVLPEYLSNWTTRRVEEQGVCVIPKAQIQEVSSIHNHIKLVLSTGQSILTDHVVLCVGCDANTDLASLSGLEVDKNMGGFVVNAELEARRHLFVAGDAACFFDPLLGRRRVEHHDHSVVSGRLAGENMVGLRKPYTHQSMFWSDLGPEIGYEGIGLIDSSLPTVGVFAKASPADLQKSKSHLEKISYQSEKVDKAKAKKSETDKTSNSDDICCPKKEAGEQAKEASEANEEEDYDNLGKGVVFYLKDDVVVGVLLWNIFNRINIARQVINENKKFEDLNEVAKLFEIHS